MKSAQLKKISLTILVLIAIILALSLVSAGVTYPRPKNIQLTPGQSSFFTFKIQQTGNYNLVCKYMPEDLGGLEIQLNDQYEIPAGESIYVKGTVTLPSSAAPANYEATFCMECSPKSTSGGSAVKIRYCNLPITVQGVLDRTRTNQYDIKETSLLWLILLIVIIILILLIWYIIKKKRQK